MAEERTIACPECGAERQTKAPRGVRVGCPSCGKKFITPEVTAPEPPADKKPAPDKAPKPKPAPDDTSSNRSRTVKATSTQIRRAPKPAKKTSSKAPVSKPEPPKPAERAKPQPAKAPTKTKAPVKAAAPAAGKPKPPVDQGRSKAAGARGGIAFYRKRFSRG